MKPFLKDLIREITLEDVQRLRRIPIDHISKFNSDKANNDLARLNAEMDEVKNNLDNLIAYAIRWFKHLKENMARVENVRQR